MENIVKALEAIYYGHHKMAKYYRESGDEESNNKWLDRAIEVGDVIRIIKDKDTFDKTVEILHIE